MLRPAKAFKDAPIVSDPEKISTAIGVLAARCFETIANTATKTTESETHHTDAVYTPAPGSNCSSGVGPAKSASSYSRTARLGNVQVV